MKKNIMKLCSAVILSIGVYSTVPVLSATSVIASTRITHGEGGLPLGQSSAYTNRIHATGHYTIRIEGSKKVRIKIFRYGKVVHSFVTKKSAIVKRYKGYGDYSLRAYNNKKKKLSVGLQIDAS